MKRSMKLLLYILFMAWLFAMIDWQVIYLTRFKHPEWKDWMHAHEKQYALVKGTLEYIMSAPSVPLKPIFAHAIMEASTSQSQRDAIKHAPYPSWSGFYRPVVRGEPYVFVHWWAWFLKWFGWGVVWLWGVVRLNFTP
jgi:hypothetical protein